MADSTMSDADKIRMKRLAKLGGNQQNGTPASPPAANGAPPAGPAESVATMSPPAAEPQASEISSTTAEQQSQIKQEEKKKTTPQITVHPRPASPAKRERDGSERPRSRAAEKQSESLEAWQDRSLKQIFRVTLNEKEVRDAHGHSLIYLGSTKDDIVDAGSPELLNTEVLEGAITEAASQAPNGKPFEYLLQCFKRVSRGIRGTRYTGPEDPKHDILNETRRLCMSYCIFAVTMPEMFGDNVTTSNPLVDHLLADPDADSGICSDFLTEASNRFEEDETIKDAIVAAAEELSKQLSKMSMLGDFQHYVLGMRNLLRFPKIVEAITQSSMWLPESVEPQDIETNTLLGPFFRLSPMQIEVAQNYFSSPKTRDRSFISNAQSAVRMTLKTHQAELFQIADTIVRAGPKPREAILNWFALCVNKNHKKRAMRVDYKTVSSDGFMVNITAVLDQLCEPFMDARFSKIDRIDVKYFRRNPRVDISDETKINVDQKAADEFYAEKADGTNNFISEIFFITVAAHHYGNEAAQTRMDTMRKSAQRMEKDLEQVESERHKYINDPRYLQRFEEHVTRVKKQIDDYWSTIHATNGVLLDDVTQARSMQFMRYVIVWLLRLASRQDLPTKEQLKLPLPDEQPIEFKCLPEYFLEDITDNFKFITRNIPHILTPQQCDEIVQICVTFLRNSEYVKNPGVKSGLVTILFYGSREFQNRPKGVLGDLLVGSNFANKHLLRALMKFYIEAESTGTHTQFFDKFNIRFEIFQVIKVIWTNTLYRENLAKEARVNTDFFVQFVNMLVNDVTFVLDESLSAFAKIKELSDEIKSPAFNTLEEEQKKEKQELLDDYKGRARSYMQLTTETMEMLILFSESLAGAFTMPEIVTRLADMLDYNLESMVGPKSKNLIVEDRQQYGFNPQALLSDIVSVFSNLSGKQSFVQAIARDGRSYKPKNFELATYYMNKHGMKSPDELRVWENLEKAVAEAKAADEEEEQDLGEIPDEFLDPLVADLMSDPVILPSSKAVLDRSTIRSHLLSDPTDPFNRSPLKIDEVVPDTEMKAKIDAWKAERKAARRAEKEEAMDTS